MTCPCFNWSRGQNTVTSPLFPISVVRNNSRPVRPRGMMIHTPANHPPNPDEDKTAESGKRTSPEIHRTNISGDRSIKHLRISIDRSNSASSIPSPGPRTGLVLLDEADGPRLGRTGNRHGPGVAQKRIQRIETLPEVPACPHNTDRIESHAFKRDRVSNK